jgi:hypothetical protein
MAFLLPDRIEALQASPFLFRAQYHPENCSVRRHSLEHEISVLCLNRLFMCLGQKLFHARNQAIPAHHVFRALAFNVVVKIVYEDFALEKQRLGPSVGPTPPGLFTPFVDNSPGVLNNPTIPSRFDLGGMAVVHGDHFVARRTASHNA